MFLLTSWFFKVHEPEVFGIKAVIMLKVVDLPAPLGPKRPRILFLATPKETPWIAW